VVANLSFHGAAALSFPPYLVVVRLNVKTAALKCNRKLSNRCYRTFHYFFERQ